MKHLVLIVLLMVLKTGAQVAPPELRCLQVLGNGNVKLSWLPPDDPGSLFNSYEVYYSPLKGGPYTLVSLNINAITTTSFVHTATTALNQGVYYYMLTTYGSAGTSSSTHSDTLRTIFLNAVPGVTALELKFNQLHLPKLPSSADIYSLYKEFPAGTWSQIAATSNTVVPDTIDRCRIKLRYQAILNDASGCASTSNIQGGEYVNSKGPEQPYVDSISVLPNGNTILTWQVPLDKDIDSYWIQYKTPAGSNALIDSVPGRMTKSYTYTTATANFTPVGVFVQARDSCKSFSTVYYELSTMHLRTAYNRCAYQTELQWNHYLWPNVPNRAPQELLEYRIYYSVNGSGFVMVGATSNTVFTHTGVAPSKNICYFVRAINKTKSVTSSSNRACFFSDQVVSPQYLYLRSASVFDKTRAELNFFLDTSQSSSGIDIQRAGEDSIYSSIGYIPFNGTQFHTFVDEKTQSDRKSYFYRGVLRDSCGNVRIASNVCKTVLLKVHNDKDKLFVKELSWNKYEGFGGTVSGYTILRILNEGHNETIVGYTDPETTSFTDNVETAAQDGASIDYRVQAVEGLGNPYGFTDVANSNPVPVYIEGRIFVPNAFAPSGVNKTWLPVTHFIEKSDYRVMVFNRWGKKVFETSDDTVAWDGSSCLPDLYVYLIEYKNARGEYMQEKGHVALLK